jgi:hypothetical protein
LGIRSEEEEEGNIGKEGKEDAFPTETGEGGKI